MILQEVYYLGVDAMGCVSPTGVLIEGRGVEGRSRLHPQPLSLQEFKVF